MEGLVKRKQVIKGQLTKAKSFIDSRGDHATFEELQMRLAKVHDLYNQFIKVEDDMFAIDHTVQSEMEAIDEVYFAIGPQLQSLCRDRSLNQTVNGEDNTQNVSDSFKSDFKLPRLNLPFFDGTLKDWHSFYDIFVSTVHENTRISPAQKFKYLLGQLKGPAYKLVCHFRSDDASYYEAFQRLTKRYEKQKPIVNEYIKHFLEQASTNKPNAPALLRVYMML